MPLVQVLVPQPFLHLLLRFPPHLHPFLNLHYKMLLTLPIPPQQYLPDLSLHHFIHNNHPLSCSLHCITRVSMLHSRSDISRQLHR